MRTCRDRIRSFPLVRLVIVVVFIGAIAIIAVPRISRGSRGADEAALRRTLAGVRTAIQMYAAEHDGNLPAQDQLEQTFISQLTTKTDYAGTGGNHCGPHIYGPYVVSIQGVPVGPNVGAKGVEVRKDVNEGERGGTVGWIYDHETGKFLANTDDLDENGVGYDTY